MNTFKKVCVPEFCFASASLDGNFSEAAGLDLIALLISGSATFRLQSKELCSENEGQTND